MFQWENTFHLNNQLNLNKKVRRIAMKSALSTKVAANEMLVVNKIELEEIKTKSMKYDNNVKLNEFTILNTKQLH